MSVNFGLYYFPQNKPLAISILHIGTDFRTIWMTIIRIKIGNVDQTSFSGFMKTKHVIFWYDCVSAANFTIQHQILCAIMDVRD